MRGVLHRFQYLVGTRKQLAPVWAKYHIVSEPDPKLKRLVGHTGIVIGIDAGGLVRTYYPSDAVEAGVDGARRAAAREVIVGPPA